MIRIGLVGVGFMGMIHYLAARKASGAQVTALCSRDAKKLAGDWRGIRGNFGPPGEQMDLRAVKQYSRFEDMLATGGTHCRSPALRLASLCAGKLHHSGSGSSS
jgi:predicted dehydrogenase